MQLHAPRLTCPPHEPDANGKAPMNESTWRVPNGMSGHRGAMTSSSALTEASTPKVTDPSGSILNRGE